MHEMSLIKDLMNKIEGVARANNSETVSEVRVKIGALAHCSAAHFVEHFEQASAGTCANHARLCVTLDSDEHSPFAQDIILESVEIANEL